MEIQTIEFEASPHKTFMKTNKKHKFLYYALILFFISKDNNLYSFFNMFHSFCWVLHRNFNHHL